MKLWEAMWVSRRLIQKDFDFMKASIEGVYSKYFTEKIETLYLDNKEYKKRSRQSPFRHNKMYVESDYIIVKIHMTAGSLVKSELEPRRIVYWTYKLEEK